MDTKEICQRLVCSILTTFSIALMIASALDTYSEDTIEHHPCPPVQNTTIPVRTSQGIVDVVSDVLSSEIENFDTSNFTDDMIESTDTSDAIDTESTTLEPEMPSLNEIHVSEDAIIVLCKMVWGEARGLSLKEEAACVWVALNRVDSDGYGDDIITVVTAPSQFTGYRPSNPVTDEIRQLVEDVIARWELEKIGVEDCGRVIPKDYLWFRGNSQTNWFRNSYAKPYTIWDWSLPDPYT